MKKILIVLLGLFMLPLAANAAKFEEGTHYQVVKQTGSKKPEVLEFFSYLCPHCFQFAPLMEKVKENLPEGVPVKKSHVQFLGREMGVELSRAFAVSELLKVESQFSPAMFNAIHVQKRHMNNLDDIKAVFAEIGIDSAKYDSAAGSFPVNGMMSQMKRNTQTFDIRGTPSVIVNGKFKVESGSVKSLDEYSALINYLVKKVD